jgi:alpha-L-rhamnosidase
LRVEHLGSAELGLGERRPRLSWRLPEDARTQQSYRLEITGHDVIEVDSKDHILVPWPGRTLGPREHMVWRVQVRTEQGESEWSHPSWFETGLLVPGDWKARWIDAASPEDAAHVFRYSFSLDRLVAQARLYATAHGIYEVFLNGNRVGTQELTPGFTSYPVRLQAQTYDVTSLLLAGTNVCEAIVTDGWFRGRTGFTQARNGYGDRLAFLAQLHADDAVIATGPEWESASGPIVAADLMAGQNEDRRRVERVWKPVTLGDYGASNLVNSPAPPVRRTQELQPVTVRQLGPKRHVVDLGQNINGWIRLTGLGPSEEPVTFVHGEILDADGTVSQANLQGYDPSLGSMLSVGQIDSVISSPDDEDTFEPRHTTHGFQFVQVDGLSELRSDDIRGVVVHTDFKRVGTFRCSDEGLNRLHDAAEWSFRDNACDIPTDCPQRERSGWTGDWQVFAPAAAFLFDVAGFSLKWLRDVSSEQLSDGRIPNFAPDPFHYKQLANPLPIEPGSSGWGDAIVMVPWEMWRAYADAGILAELWPAMDAWLDYGTTQAREHRSEARRRERPEAAPHEKFVWDTGFHWGEWLEPGESGVPEQSADHSAVATAFLCHSAGLMAHIARVLGYRDEQARLEELSEKVRNAWQMEFMTESGDLHPDTQATYVRALAFDLVPAAARGRVADRLVELVRAAGTHLGTGFLATPYLLPVLADAGRANVAYDLLFQDTSPSWLTMIERGATTIWESWDGEQGGMVSSLNHYSKGAVISFLHRYVAGIRSLDDHPGYRRFRVEPVSDPRLEWAQASHESPYGLIESWWQRDGQDLELVVTVPPGSAADIVLPDGTAHVQRPGTTTYRAQVGHPVATAEMKGDRG